MAHDSNGAIGGFMHHLQLAGKPPTTRRIYRGRLQDLAQFLGDENDLLTAGYDELYAWRESLTVADSSIGNYLSAIKSFYNWAIRRGLIDHNPAQDIPVPPNRRRLPRPISDADLEDAIALACERVRPWLVLAGYAGLRCCEIATLHRESVYDAAPNPFLIVLGKGDKERAIPMSPYVWSELKLAGVPRRGWMFGRRDGRPGPVSANIVSQRGNAHLVACEIDATMHQLRHRFGTATYAESRDLRLVQELMGHNDPATSAIYVGYSDPDAIDAVNAIQPKHRGLRAVPDYS